MAIPIVVSFFFIRLVRGCHYSCQPLCVIFKSHVVVMMGLKISWFMLPYLFVYLFKLFIIVSFRVEFTYIADTIVSKTFHILKHYSNSTTNENVISGSGIFQENHLMYYDSMTFTIHIMYVVDLKFLQPTNVTQALILHY